jgi:hypothetical protein
LRLLPWVCQAHHLRGFVMPGLTGWPAAWRGLAQDPPPRWPATPRSETALFYPGPAGPVPSLRAVRLRDGLEDYELLHALSLAVAEGRIAEEAAREALKVQLYGPHPTRDELEALARVIPEARLAVARLLAGLPPPE